MNRWVLTRTVKDWKSCKQFAAVCQKLSIPYHKFVLPLLKIKVIRLDTKESKTGSVLFNIMLAACSCNHCGGGEAAFCFQNYPIVVCHITTDTGIAVSHNKFYSSCQYLLCVSVILAIQGIRYMICIACKWSLCI